MERQRRIYLFTARENNCFKKLIKCFTDQLIIITDAFTQFFYNCEFVQLQLCWIFEKYIPYTDQSIFTEREKNTLCQSNLLESITRKILNWS